MNLQPVAIGIEPSPYGTVFVVCRVVLNEHDSLPSIAVRQLFQDSEVRGSVEEGLLPVMEASLPQFNRSKNLHGLALPGHGNFWGTAHPAPGGVLGRILAKAGFVGEDQCPVGRGIHPGAKIPLFFFILLDRSQRADHLKSLLQDEIALGSASDGQRAAGTRDLAASALVTPSLCQEQEKRKMGCLEIQIGNSGFIACGAFISFWVTME